MIAVTRLADVFVEVADTLVADFDLLDFLSHLTDNAAEVSGADAVGLVLADHRNVLRFMAASNDSGKALELFQLAASEGPCLDAFLTHEAVVNADLGEAADLWPRFAPAARDAGFRSVHAFPMRLRAESIGALNLFSRETTHFSHDEVRVVQAMADVATIAILQEQALGRAEVLTGQLQTALNSRIIIEQAKGALARAEGISVDEAFTIIRHRARSTQRRLTDVATEILGD